MADEKQTNEQTQKGATTKGLNPIIVIVLVCLNMLSMILLAGVAFYIFINQPKNETIVDILKNEQKVNTLTQEHKRETSSINKEEFKEEKKEVGALFQLERFVVNLADKTNTKYLNALIDFELSDEALSEEVERRMPQIRDIIIMLLSNKKSEQISDSKGREILKEEIKNTVNGLLIKGKITNVYFTNFVIN